MTREDYILIADSIAESFKESVSHNEDVGIANVMIKLKRRLSQKYKNFDEKRFENYVNEKYKQPKLS